MLRSRKAAPLARWVLSLVGLLLIGYLAAVALQPAILDQLPSPVSWFGRPGSMATIAIVVGVLGAVSVLTFRSSASHRLVGVSFTIIALLVSASAVLGLSAYWRCHDDNHPAVFTPLMWTAQLVKGGVGDTSLSGRTCPNPTPVALELARFAALSAIFTGLGGVVVGIFRSRVDRLRANLADSVTVIVGGDDDTQPMLSGVARALDRHGTLVLITNADNEHVQRARRQGARVVLVDFNAPSSLASLRLWRHLGRLCLMSPDPSTNLLWLDVTGRRVAQLGNKQWLPLIVRIDDPWLAESWRAKQFGGSDTRWAADVVGKYEVTASRLLDGVMATGRITRVFVCGSSQLTLALCAELTRRALERDFYTAPGAPPAASAYPGRDGRRRLRARSRVLPSASRIRVIDRTGSHCGFGGADGADHVAVDLRRRPHQLRGDSGRSRRRDPRDQAGRPLSRDARVRLGPRHQHHRRLDPGGRIAAVLLPGARHPGGKDPRRLGPGGTADP
ncbi:hypothetical protein OSH39_07450 [Mycobacterium ulcerans]|uniref:hypothetical protein n=1 Tax=Mycobacterium ulcerans TaxID=1809 RepID=UPI0002DA245E|nr:hypothetical protein [Mycobacterium ulcerans]MEB3905003.1 hypothetical protein [Mycobacterium ulcerans]MEB3909152.1 hypothetical protein [Mycobacterium ulcerans]MEB3919393.1 hypothetical protein [Mycobacterium ulcerans]MEB3923517.1 hypothetical protein [Mycobacterium ulcerans]MEB3927660.1 hypothetical protein [Mycobacterium ulcerans]